MTRRSVRANVTVTVEPKDTPLAAIDYQADSRYVVHETNFDVVTRYSCDEASEAGFSCAEFERRGFSCEACACAGRRRAASTGIENECAAARRRRPDLPR